MSYIKEEDIKEYVSKNPTGIAGMSKDLTDMVNYFVEQIVIECAEFITPLGDYCGGHGEPSAPSSRECARRLKQHFGVKDSISQS